MSGFSPEWLALREPVDHRSRDEGLAGRVATRFAAHQPVRITDLGCGAGSNLRATAPRLGPSQEWTLVDYDPRLLAAARERLSAWADTAEESGEGLALVKGGRRIGVRFVQADLDRELDAVLDRPTDLVTAAALFDLVSAPWLRRFIEALAARALPLYTVLSYDGVEARGPAHPADGAIFAAFHHHQRTDKGFGPAAGPDATAIMASMFAERGYEVHTAPSPWQLHAAEDRALMVSLSSGIAGAVRETRMVAPELVDAWEAAAVETHTVGHLDVFAAPAL